MTELDIAYVLNRATGLVAAIFALGLALGYARVLDSNSPLVRAIAWSITLLTFGASVECLRVVDTNNMSTHILAILYNLVVWYACFRGLQAQHRMIPVEERPDWHWYSAPLYPPWSFVTGLERFVARLMRRKWKESRTATERRQRQQPITFPDRRNNDE